MRHALLAVLLSAVSLASSGCRSTTAPTAAVADVPRLDARFTGATLRFDYDHVGTAGVEHVAPHGYRVEGPWAGSTTVLVDPTGNGLYRFVVRDAASGTTLWSRGFCSIFGEWQTTGPAKTAWRSFQESQRFPEPVAPVVLALEKRDPSGEFREFWRGDLDPASRFVNRAPLTPWFQPIEFQVNGPTSTQVDLLLLAEGYALDGQPKFERDARRLLDALFATEPWRSRRTQVSVRGLFVSGSSQSGISDPRRQTWRRGVYGTSFNAFDSDRYVLTFEDRHLREIAAHAPYDALAILIDDDKYGGGGIYNLWTTVTVDTEPAEYVFVHELGHSFAGLADEYYTSQVAYEDVAAQGVEPWEPNVTALVGGRPKWADLVDADVPIPTPWRQGEYDAHDLAYQARRQELIARGAPDEAHEAEMRAVKAWSTPFLASERWAGRVGAFEGAMYQAKGLYRPSTDCIMFTRDPVPFCAPCRRAIERAIDLYTR